MMNNIEKKILEELHIFVIFLAITGIRIDFSISALYKKKCLTINMSVYELLCLSNYGIWYTCVQ